MPSWKTNCIEDWETKIDAIVEETQRKYDNYWRYSILGSDVF